MVPKIKISRELTRQLNFSKLREKLTKWWTRFQRLSKKKMKHKINLKNLKRIMMMNLILRKIIKKK